MTSPIEIRQVRCPKCGTVYETAYRASINTMLDPQLADPEYIDKMTTGTCPNCGFKASFGGLVVGFDSDGSDVLEVW